MRMTSGVPLGASASTYAPLAALSAEANVSPDAAPVAALEHRDVLAGERDAGGAGVAARGVSSHTTAVSLASAGRTTVKSGMARSAASCSIGWCVGPSSPSATESCVQT